jgi:hypothetical protein
MQGTCIKIKSVNLFSITNIYDIAVNKKMETELQRLLDLYCYTAKFFIF